MSKKYFWKNSQLCHELLERARRSQTSDSGVRSHMTSGQIIQCAWSVTLRPRGLHRMNMAINTINHRSSPRGKERGVVHSRETLPPPSHVPRARKSDRQESPPLILTKSSSILVWHFSKLIRFMATRSCLGLHRAA